ncbi:hypothetical protein NC653_039990 [Populus alba x Populus x berolinensis]|uniref:Uncharacterized protein n=1 Tax=Populus alba x Populus x berolinensis TaxID=444605 RepID=A0AAD6LF71_9ROSI|nr:hypothetical protein NC653_039990 [Populus alba x Populus x berolinensis]
MAMFGVSLFWKPQGSCNGACLPRCLSFLLRELLTNTSMAEVITQFLLDHHRTSDPRLVSAL